MIANPPETGATDRKSGVARKRDRLKLGAVVEGKAVPCSVDLHSPQMGAYSVTVASKASRCSIRSVAFVCFALAGLSPIRAAGQTADAAAAESPSQLSPAGDVLGSEVPSVAIQPLAQQVRRLESALDFLGQPLSQGTQDAINRAVSDPDAQVAVHSLQRILDAFVLAIVDINAESRVRVERGPAEAALIQGGSRFFLVKVINRAGVTSPLVAASPNSGDVYIRSTGDPAPKMLLTESDARDRWANIAVSTTPPMEKRLSGLPVEYQLLEIYSRDAGQRTADISFNVGQGSQDIGFRNNILVLFHAAPVHEIKLHVADESGQAAVASLTIRDRANRVYPNPSKRLAPDFFFQPQIYRSDGESISLPPGEYTVTSTGGPEYRAQTQAVSVSGKDPLELTIALERWVDPSEFGWYSGDSHVHAAGCSHYQNPEEGVLPKDMMRQLKGASANSETLSQSIALSIWLCTPFFKRC